MVESFLDVLSQWPSKQELADDLGVSLYRVQKWQTRKRIPAEFWPSIITAAQKRGLSVTAETLVQATRHWRSGADARASA